VTPQARPCGAARAPGFGARPNVSRVRRGGVRGTSLAIDGALLNRNLFGDPSRTRALPGFADSNVELSARRLAEQSGIPSDNDPMWLLLHEMQRAMREAAGGVNTVLANDAFADRVSSAIGINVANDERVVAALTSAIKNTREAAMHAIRSLEVALHDVARRRAAAPFASLMFAFALGLTACCA